LKARSFQVIDCLGLLRSAHTGKSFQFDNDRIETDKISTAGRPKPLPLVMNWQSHFASKGNISSAKFNGQSFLYRLKESVAELFMYFNCGAHDRVSARIAIIETFHYVVKLLAL